MNENDVSSELSRIFRQVFLDDSLVVRRGLTPNDVPNWTSLAHIEMLTEVEASFGIKFTFRELRKIQDVNDLIDLILSKKGIS